jgi:hypothetical protein
MELSAMANKVIRPVVVNEMMEFYRGKPAQPVDARLQYNQQREAFDKGRGVVSPLGNVAKPAPPRAGLKNR